MTTFPVHRQPPLKALLLSMVASMGDHQGHSALPTAWRTLRMLEVDACW